MEAQRVSIQMRAIEQYLPILLFSALYKNCTNHSKKATEHYFTVVLFVMLFKVALTLESANQILQCSHRWNDSSLAELANTLNTSGVAFYAVKGGSNFRVCGLSQAVNQKLFFINK